MQSAAAVVMPDADAAVDELTLLASCKTHREELEEAVLHARGCLSATTTSEFTQAALPKDAVLVSPLGAHRASS